MAETAPFAPGQIWTYHGATPASSRVIIGAVDTFAGESQPVVSISITDAHGGRISAHPREGGGAVFRVRLPLAESPT